MCLQSGYSIFAVALLLFPKIPLCSKAHCATISIPGMCMAIWSFGVCLVCHTYNPQNRQQQDTDLFADHAKLKDYVATMEGQLDAQIQEGGMSFFFLFPSYFRRFSLLPRQIAQEHL